VEVGVSIYLVGCSDSTVSLVAEITDKESVDALRLGLAQGATEPAPRSFVSVLSGLFGGAGGPDAAGDTVSYLRKQKERLRRLQ
jgi:flagellar protein FliO/FliZ